MEYRDLHHLNSSRTKELLLINLSMGFRFWRCALNSITTLDRNLRVAKRLWGPIPRLTLCALEDLTREHHLSVAAGELLLLQGNWYVTHAGLIGIARRSHCLGIQVRPVLKFCNPSARLWAFQATVYKTTKCRGFVGYGDADPSNVSPLVRGAEMRIAETRAVNRALRKAYGIGICSVEEIGSIETRSTSEHPIRKVPPESANGDNVHAGTGNGSRVRDHLCQLIRQHKLNAELVKSYAVDFCGTKNLREASREQVETFVAQLADRAQKDRDSLLCQLNSYATSKEGAA